VLIDAMACNPKDRHVLAGAVTGRAQVLVTFIVKPFPLASVDPHDLTVVTRTPFCSTSSTSTPGRVGRALVGQRTAARRPGVRRQPCEHYFGKPRQRGTSHAVFKMPWPGDPRVNIQDDKGKAKAYQVRQVLEVIDKKEGL
jgi:hypothetical protein